MEMAAKRETWINAESRPPTAADADEWGCVLVWHIYQGPMITSWRQVEKNCFMTHWQHTPIPPEAYQNSPNGGFRAGGMPR